MLSLNIPPRKLFDWFRRPQLWAPGDWQLHHDNSPAYASCLMQSFFVKHQITRVTQPPYRPDLVPCDFWLFQKLRLPMKRKRVQSVNEIQENTTGHLTVIGRSVWGLKVLPQKGTEVSLSDVQCFLYLVSSSIKVSIFPITRLDTFWTDLTCRVQYCLQFQAFMWSLRMYLLWIR